MHCSVLTFPETNERIELAKQSKRQHVDEETSITSMDLLLKEGKF